jgi:hypothetical protein
MIYSIGYPPTYTIATKDKKKKGIMRFSFIPRLHNQKGNAKLPLSQPRKEVNMRNEGFTTIEVPIEDRMQVSEEAKRRGMLVRHFAGMVIKQGMEFFCQGGNQKRNIGNVKRKKESNNG